MAVKKLSERADEMLPRVLAALPELARRQIETETGSKLGDREWADVLASEEWKAGQNERAVSANIMSLRGALDEWQASVERRLADAGAPSRDK